MSMRQKPSSVSPVAFDPTAVSGSPRPSLRGVPMVHAVLDGPVVRKTSTVLVRPDDKEVFDALQSWWHLRHGVALTQWELFTQVLSAALADRDGAFAGALEV